MNQSVLIKGMKRFERLRRYLDRRLGSSRFLLPVLALVVILMGSALALMNYNAADPQIGRYQKALSRGDYTDAGRFFAEDIRGNLELEQTAQGLVVRQIERLKEEYAEREIDKETIADALDKMRDAQLLAGSEILDLAVTELEVLEISQKAFDEARRQEDQGNPGAAIEAYQQVQLLDPNYEEAQIRLNGLRGTYVRETEAEVRSYLADEKIPQALSLLDEAQKLMPGETVFAELRGETQAQQSRDTRSAILRRSQADRDRGDYTLALSRLSQAMDIYPEDPSFINLYMDIRLEVDDLYLTEASRLWAARDKAGALSAVKAGLDIVPDSPYLLTRLDFYEANDPPAPEDPVDPGREDVE